MQWPDVRELPKMLVMPQGHKRGRRSEARFNHRPSRRVIVILTLLFAGVAALMISGGKNDGYHKILVKKPLKRTTPN
jgi:hypothetical protein